jgi:very-short-patch-repair endonuclease
MYYNVVRTWCFELQGYNVIHIWSNQVENDLNGVIRVIEFALKED